MNECYLMGIGKCIKLLEVFISTTITFYQRYVQLVPMNAIAPSLPTSLSLNKGWIMQEVDGHLACQAAYRIGTIARHIFQLTLTIGFQVTKKLYVIIGHKEKVDRWGIKPLMIFMKNYSPCTIVTK